MHNYDEVYAYFSENNLEDLFIDFENDQLLGEAAFQVDDFAKRIKRVEMPSDHQNQNDKNKNPIWR